MKRILVVVLAALAPISVLEAQTLSLDSCVSLALQNNKTIRSARLQVEQLKHTKKAYWANFFPNFSAQALDAYGSIDGSLPLEVAGPVGQYAAGKVQQYAAAGLLSTEQIQTAQRILSDVQGDLTGLNPAIDYKMGNVFSASIQVEQPIYMGGKITAAYRMAKLGLRMAEQGEAVSRDEVIVRTHEAYALLLKATELREVACRYDTLLDRLLTDVSNAQRHGLAGRNEVLKVQVKKNEAELQVRQAENAIALARMNLCHQLGLPLTQEVGVEGGVAASTSPDMDGRRAGGVESRPEYAYLALKSQLAAQQVKLERAEFLPQLGVGAQVGYSHGLEVMDRRLLGDDPYFLAMATLKIPIYHANEAHHKVKAARLAYDRALLEQQDLVEQMNLELQQAANRLDEAILEARLSDRNLESATENLRESRRSYELGLESLSDLLMAQTLWQQAFANQVVAHSQIIVSTAKYRKAAGTL